MHGYPSPIEPTLVSVDAERDDPRRAEVQPVHDVEMKVRREGVSRVAYHAQRLSNLDMIPLAYGK